MSDLLTQRQGDRADGNELWLLSAQRRSRLSPTGFGLACGLVVAATVLAPLWFGDQPMATSDIVAPGLFFGLSIGVLVGFTPHIFPGAVRDFHQLLPLLTLTADERVAVERSLTRMPMKTMWQMTGVGLVLGVGHSWLLGTIAIGGLVGWMQGLGTTALWVAMFWTIPPLLANAEIF